MSNFETIINSIRSILRNEGITGMDSINHCVAFVIMKYLTIQKCENFNIPVKYAYENFLNDNNNQPFSNNDHRILTKFYSVDAEDDDLLSHLRDKFNFNQFRFKITSPFNFFTIFKKISELNLDDISEEYDIVGMIYEIHLKTGTSNSLRDLGQFFTHRKVIKYMVELCEPKLKSNGEIETILDPSLGTGGFLTMSIKYLNKKYQNINWNLNKSNIYGFDIDDNVRNLALLNTLLESGQILNNNIVKNDTLQNDYTLDYKTVINSVDIILANEPFGLKSLKYKDCCKRIKELKIDGTKSEPLFLQLMMRSLNKNGRCAVIVPEGVLFNDASLHTGTRKYLIENLNLKKIISLGDKLFLNTGVKSSILYFVNNGKTTEVEYLNIKLANGTLIEESIIKVKVDDIIRNKYYLGINKYLKTEEIKHEGLEYKKLGEICNIEYGTRIKKIDEEVEDKYKDDKYPCYGGGDISFYMKKYNREGLNLVISRFGVSNNCVRIINGKFWLNDSGLTLKAKNNLEQKYINYYFLTKKQIIYELATGACQKNLDIDEFKNIEIPIPSLEIQNKIVNTLDIIYNKIELNKKSINSYEKIKSDLVWLNTLNCEKKKLNNIIKYLPKSKRQASFGNDNGNYPFYTSSNILSKYCNEADYNEECLIIGTGGLANIKIANNFSCSTDNFIIKSEYNKYIYYYLSTNINILNDLFHGSTIKHLSKSDLDNIELPLPSLEIQNKLIQECEYYDNQINILNQENLKLESNNIIDIILASLNKTDEDSEKIIISSNDNISEDSEEFTKIKKVKKSVSKSK